MKSMFSRGNGLFVAVLAAASPWAATAGAGEGLRIVARTGDAVAGAEDVQLRQFGRPAINDGGAVVFWCNLLGPGVVPADDECIVRLDGAGPSVVAREGRSASSLSDGSSYDTLTEAVILNDVGQVLFRSTLAGPAVNEGNDVAYFLADELGTRTLARAGDPAPGTIPGVVFGTLTGARLSDTGRVMFLPSLAGTFVAPSNDRALYEGTPGSLTMVAREGDFAAGFQDGTGYSRLITGASNAAGEVVFTAELAGPSVTSSDNQGMWAGTAGSMVLVGRTGDAAPGLALEYTNFDGTPGIDALGRVIFEAHLNGSASSGQNQGLFAGAAGAIGLLVHGGTPAPGLPESLRNLSDPLINSSGGVVFHTTMGSASDSAIFAGTIGDLHLVAREGSVLPGLEPGQYASSIVQNPSLNEAGNIVFTASLAGAGVTPDNSTALYWYDVEDGFHLIARTGTALELAPNVSATLEKVSLFWEAGGEDGKSRALNDRGDVALHLIFTDLTEAVAIWSPPETCPCDLTDDDEVDVFDLLAYLDLWFAADPAADLVGGAEIDVFDLLEYLDCWFADCPS